MLSIDEMTKSFGLDDASIVANDHGRIRGQLLREREERIENNRQLLSSCEQEDRELLASEQREFERNNRVVDFINSNIEACGSRVRELVERRSGYDFITPGREKTQRWLPTVSEYRQAQAGMETRTLTTSSMLTG